ncbi:MAG: response regulator transcription factor [Oleispira sp.]|nr:response regulator transcription factor [Oleispira sp.]
MVDQQTHILVVEDDTEICRLLRLFLETEGFVISFCHHGIEAVEQIRNSQPDLIVLDVMLPGQDGIQVCKQIRNFYSGPVLMLTACEDDISELTGFKVGADDYVRKPIKPEVLLMRLQALLRRSQGAKLEPIDNVYCDELTINFSRREVLLHKELVELHSSEIDLVLLLAQSQGQAVSRDECFRALRGFDYDGIDRSLDMRISSLRKKIVDQKSPHRFIKTVRGVGYMLASGNEK